MVAAFFAKQDRWTREQVAGNQEDEFWKQIGLVQAQYDGLKEGYGAAGKTISFIRCCHAA